MNKPSFILRHTPIRLGCDHKLGSLLSVAFLFAILWAPNPVLAHGFAYKYDLPVPLNLYVLSSSFIVFISFLMLLWWGTKTQNILKMRVSYTFTSATCNRARVATTILGGFSVILLATLLAIGFLGDQNTLRNPLPVTIWVLWWVGFFYFTALILNTWNALNPWSFCFRLAETIAGKTIQLIVYPTWLGYWPSFLFLVIFLWVELVWPNKESPSTLATLIIAYSLITWSGMTIFGRLSWLKYGECFSVLFTLIGHFSPLQFSKTKRTLKIQPPAFGILSMDRPSMGLVLITILLLAGLSFDGFMATETWLQFKHYILHLNVLDSTFRKLHQNFGNLQIVLSTFGLALTLLIFLFSYIGVSAVTKILVNWSHNYSKQDVSLQEIMEHFVTTLLPIAIGYHIAHYLSYLLIAGQLIIPLLSDPFGMGWNLFDTNEYRINIGIINAQTMWNITLLSVIGGHMLGMFLSHIQANRLYQPTHKIIIQVPLVTLMILYTGASLWILAQPIVES